jgi:hypothetical protein
MTRVALLTVAALTMAGSALAQTPTPARPTQTPTPRPPVAQAPAAPTVPAAPPAPSQTPGSLRPPMPVGAQTNIRLELAITDTLAGTPVKKNVTLLVMSGGSGMIRTSNVVGRNSVNLSIDAAAQVLPSGQISARITFEYQPAMEASGAAPEGTAQRPGFINESLTVLLQDGRPLLVSQSADPASERTVKVELTATVQK